MEKGIAGSVRLKRLEEEDRQALRQILTNGELAKTYLLPEFSHEGEVQALIDRFLKLSLCDQRYVRGICLDDVLVGVLNDTGTQAGSIEMGWAVHPAWQNRGVCTAAVKSAMKELYLLGFREIIAGAFEENAASIRVMEKCGMKLQSRSEIISYRGRNHTCVYYCKTREDWEHDQ